MNEFQNEHQNYQQQPPYSPYPPQHNPIKTNSKAIPALVLGILAVVIPYIGLIIGIIAIVFARLSLKEIRATGEQGKGMSIAGLVCGIVGTAMYAIILVILIIAVLFVSGSSY
ncbi:hypothetical protein J2Z69_002278 [Paenibacillus shirakamiensis]|uniref:DUF4190 domain-containing protein n=1 Tax=Paenibacillus shirakamiensis TaxID=1265935 RepID=A0ABS4JJD9_9BACL|nr:DUF4190 domain-containing protein [Paenibacillus shirakamiensis]MBP2001235.1 hypothetical protein [Paenibacillus shirakamiensis]